VDGAQIWGMELGPRTFAVNLIQATAGGIFQGGGGGGGFGRNPHKPGKWEQAYEYKGRRDRFLDWPARRA
jgi:hypothetical protein